MKIITVSGTHSGVGKTTFIEQMLRKLKNWSCLKVTVSKDNCPRDKTCGICPEIKNPFYIIKEEDIINQPGKDTARFKFAGAKEVIWLKAKPIGLKAGLSKALLEFSDCEGIIIEGTSVLGYIKPDLAIYLEGKNREIKESAKQFKRKADVILAC